MEEQIADRPTLDQMPLHDITRLYGEAGLEERFTLEIDRLDCDDDTRRCIYGAFAVMLYAHAGDMRGKYPYSTHILRVATRIIHRFGVQDPEIIVAALLHDVVEDQPGRLAVGDTCSNPEDAVHRPGALDFIERHFGAGVRKLVESCTNPESEPGSDKAARHTQYREHVIEAMEDDPRARIIKLSDFIDNASGLHYNESPGHARSLALKYRPLIAHMRGFAIDPTTPLSDSSRDYILAQLDRAETHCHALLPSEA